MDQILYANSGAEAVENAVKLAKGTLRRPGVIGFHNAFHGRTHLAMALTCSQAHYRGHCSRSRAASSRPLLRPVPHAGQRGPRRLCPLRPAPRPALRDLRDDVACIIAEPIQGEGGFIVPKPEFFRELRKIADEIGACLIIDEIQAGLGRTGKWFCHEHYGITADIVTMAKGIASGFPLSAIISRKENFDKFKPGTMGGTYGGNAVACAAGMATIDAIREEGMIENAARQGEKIRAFLTEKQAQYPSIGDVRGKGLMDAIEIVKPGTKEPAPARPRRSWPPVTSATSSSWAPAVRQLRALPAGAQHPGRRPRRRLQRVRRGRQGGLRRLTPKAALAGGRGGAGRRRRARSIWCPARPPRRARCCAGVGGVAAAAAGRRLVPPEAADARPEAARACATLTQTW